MALPYKGQITVLQGLPSAFHQQLLLHIASLDAAESAEQDLQPLLVEIQSLLDTYSDLFEPPTSLPPSRACDHEIPLIPRAAPILVRSYRYPPMLKDEIEKQVQEMLS